MKFIYPCDVRSPLARLVLFLALTLFICSSHAGETQSFSTRTQQRPLSADRPDSTESPITVPAGRFQLETSFVAFTRDDHGNGHDESWVFAETNFKFGLTDHTDIQLVIAPYTYLRERSDGSTAETGGFGDLTLRFKWNLWGNDGDGRTAFGLLPYIKIPVQTKVSNGHWEGGLILPFACDLTDSVSFGCQVEVANAYDESAGQYWVFGHTAVLGFALTEKLGLYLEYAGAASELPYEAFASAGLTYLVDENLQLDIGMLGGLNDDSDDLTAFTGLTVRF